jgi:hypothetical protein
MSRISIHRTLTTASAGRRGLARAGIPRRPRGGAGVFAVAAVAALAAFGVHGAAHLVAQRNSAAPLNWVKQAPRTGPQAALTGASMAYDAATGNIVLFGGANKRSFPLGGT